MAPALIGECAGRIAEMSARSSSPEIQGLIDLYLGWMLKNAKPECCIMFGRVIIESGYGGDIGKSSHWLEYAKKFSDLIADDKPAEVNVIFDTFRLDSSNSLVLKNHVTANKDQLHGAMYGELTLRIALDKPPLVDQLISAYIGWFVNNNANINFIMKILKEVKGEVTPDFWKRENVIAANKMALLKKVAPVNG